MKLFILSEDKKVIAKITKSIAKKDKTLLLAFVRKKTSTIVKIKDNHPEIENERNQTIRDRTARAPNIIRTRKDALAINIPKMTGIIKLT
jgi:hypothetical protein